MPPEARRSRRVTIVADEMLGYDRTGGLGTATTFLALAVARMGNEVEFLYLGEPTAPIGAEWGRLYDSAGVTVRMLPRSNETVEPSSFARMRDTERALQADPPDVVITQDLAAPIYTALRLKQLALAFKRTLFVVYCHGTRQWITDMARKVRVLPGALAVAVLEQASVELADAIVSPSGYLVRWMQEQGWRLPERALVIPYLTRAAATGEPRPQAAEPGERVERIAFFGRLEERKGLRPFAAGLNRLDPELLGKIELEFLGSATRAWPPERVEALLSATTRASLRHISFETDLDQPEVLARLSRAGTLAVMPSFGETFSNAVYECLERGIPFISSDAGAPTELIAPSDRARVLFEPTPEGVENALRRVLSGDGVPRPADPAFDPADSFAAWADLIATEASRPQRPAGTPAVDVVVVHRSSRDALSRCLLALAEQTYAAFTPIVVAGEPVEEQHLLIHGRPPVLVRCERWSVEAARHAGLRAGASAWVVFLDGDDLPEQEFLETLVRAQAAVDADVVTCALHLGDGRRAHYFPGEPGGLALLSNGYGTVALIRRSLLADVDTTTRPVEGDPDWPLLARLSVSGARIVSVPIPLVTRTRRPGDLAHHPSDALLVAHQLEHAVPAPLRSVVRLAAGLAAKSQRSPDAPAPGKAARAFARVSRSLRRR